MDPWVMRWDDYYETLGVSASASPGVITAAYRAMARDFHPDRNAHATERMKQINLAHSILSDPAQKARYDRAYRAQQTRQTHDTHASSPPPPPPPPGWTKTPPRSGASSPPGWGTTTGEPRSDETAASGAPSTDAVSRRKWLKPLAVCVIATMAIVIGVNLANRNGSEASEDDTSPATTNVGRTNASNSDPSWVLAMPIASGTYHMDVWQSSWNQEGSYGIEDIVIGNDGYSQFNIGHSRHGRTSGLTSCPDDMWTDPSVYIVMADGDVLYPVDSYCHGSPGYKWAVDAGYYTTVWWIFPTLKYGQQPFAMYYKDSLIASNIWITR